MFLLLSLVIFIKFPLTKIHKYIKIVTLNYHRTESVAQRCSVKKVFLETSQTSQENTCAGDCFNKVAGLTPQAYNFIKKESLAQVFSCEFCEISKNTFFYRTSPVATSYRIQKLR